MKYALMLLLCFLMPSLVFAARKGDFKAEPEESKSDKKLNAALAAVRIGMSKNALYNIFTKAQQEDYRQDGREEWITFGGFIGDYSGTKVIFYLKDGKVRGWNKK